METNTSSECGMRIAPGAGTAVVCKCGGWSFARDAADLRSSEDWLVEAGKRFKKHAKEALTAKNAENTKKG